MTDEMKFFLFLIERYIMTGREKCATILGDYITN